MDFGTSNCFPYLTTGSAYASMWIGLRASDSSVSCNSPATCAAAGSKLNYHSPGATNGAEDDVYTPFSDESWIDGPIDFRSSGNKLCGMMAFADDSAADNNKVEEELRC